MGDVTVNGETVPSHFFDVSWQTASTIYVYVLTSSLQHLASYPIVSDSITTFKDNKYGAKSLKYADQGYDLAKPVFPYLSKPFGYVAPYLVRADSLGDQGLTRIDTAFPILKEDTEKIRGSIYQNAQFPIRLAGDAKHHLVDTYGSEYKKCGGDGVAASGKAIITTSLVLSQESLAWINSFLQTKKDQAKEAVDEKTS